MKNDINLLYKRKSASYSGKKLFVIFIVIVLLASGLYAGIAIPSRSLAAAKIESASLDSQIGSASMEGEYALQLLQKEKLKEQLDELTALSESKSQVLDYINAVEESLPSDEAQILKLNIENKTININGVAINDETIATFCLRLRQRNIFKNVYLANSTTPPGFSFSTFTIAIELAHPLNGQDVIDEIQAENTTAPTAKPGEDSSK